MLPANKMHLHSRIAILELVVSLHIRQSKNQRADFIHLSQSVHERKKCASSMCSCSKIVCNVYVHIITQSVQLKYFY